MWKRRLAALTCLVALSWAGYVFAQAGTSWVGNPDPCAANTHLSVPISAATPTQALVTGVTGKAIYVCSVKWEQVVGATPGLTLSYGEAAASTPCATASPNGIKVLGNYGSVLGQTTTIGIGDHTIMSVPAGTSTPLADLCGLVTTTTFGQGTLEYVQQ